MPKLYMAEGATFTITRGVGVVLASDKTDDAKIDWATVIDLAECRQDSASSNGIEIGEFVGRFDIRYTVYLELGSNRLYYWGS